MAASPEDVQRLARNPPPSAWTLARAFWPGPLTLVLPAGPAISEAIHAGSGTVGLRSPDHAVALAILHAAGRPLALTSANLSGEPDATSAQDALAALNGRVDLIVDAGATALGRPSTVLNLAVQPPVILREGGVSADRLREFVSL
jgi:L-threonylcarbamoyladenylate synthase